MLAHAYEKEVERCLQTDLINVLLFRYKCNDQKYVHPLLWQVHSEKSS
jgi:hypothetical protein